MQKEPFDLPKLPPKVDYEKLITSMTKAHASLARLDALLYQLKNPKLLSRTLATKEAVLSSQIEGTQATLSEVLEHEAQGIEKENTSKEKDFREILNYRHALEKGVELLKDKPITENFIKDLHSILLSSARGHHKNPGSFRRDQVYIGKQGLGIEHASYVPPLPMFIPELFSNFENYINSDNEKDKLVQIAIAHYQFEAIHPFMDGNGRIGRLLISLMLYEKKLLTFPFIYLSEFFEEHRQEYYDLLRGVSESNDWGSWVLFFLNGLDIQAVKAQETTKKILDLHSSVNEQIIPFNSRFSHDFLEALFTNPFFTSPVIKKMAHIENSKTLFDLIAKFLKAGIISDITPDKKRNKIYRFDALADILKR